MPGNILQLVSVPYSYAGQRKLGLKQATIQATVQHVKGLYPQLAAIANVDIELYVHTESGVPQQICYEAWMMAIYHTTTEGVEVRLAPASVIEMEIDEPAATDQVATPTATASTSSSAIACPPGTVLLKIVRDVSFPDFSLPCFYLEITIAGRDTNPYDRIAQVFPAFTREVMKLIFNGTEVQYSGYRRLANKHKWTPTQGEIVLHLHRRSIPSAPDSAAAPQNDTMH